MVQDWIVTYNPSLISDLLFDRFTNFAFEVYVLAELVCKQRFNDKGNIECRCLKMQMTAFQVYKIIYDWISVGILCLMVWVVLLLKLAELNTQISMTEEASLIA